jgi:hypothetical protein
MGIEETVKPTIGNESLLENSSDKEYKKLSTFPHQRLTFIIIPGRLLMGSLTY